MRRKMLFAALLVFGIASATGCPKDKASPKPASGTSKAAAGGDTEPAATKPAATKLAGPGKVTDAYALAFKVPKDGKANATLTTAMTLAPRGEYKINMAYPFRLTVEGPADAAPAKVVLRKKDAKTFSEKGVEVHHTTKLVKAGEHRFSAEVKFSVCTQKHCELKTEQLTWVAKVQ
ncbi:MAG: hypothetical protein CSB49_04875 [Proteobacteria bacterium]|nr:MAG: hypothetical protein CSB49_04875 [Pseudomonadota bacterium]